MYHKIFSALLLFLLVSGSAQSQQTNKAVEFVKYFKVAQANLPRESVFVHTDRDWYYYGDQIWFSAYVVSGGFNFPSDLSAVLYVELVSPDGKVVQRENIKLENGHGNGTLSFEGVPKQKGTYQIKAYTLWSLNFGEAYEFSKNITVFTEKEQSQPENTEITDVQFLPESGYLVAGLKSKVGFKALDQFGLGKKVSGNIFDGSGNQITSFESEHLGMGSFEMVPSSSTAYYAEINGFKYELPTVLDKGLTMKVEQNENAFLFDIKSRGIDTSQPFLLFGHVRGEVYSASLVSFTNNGSTVRVPKQNFATGVVHFTLLDTEGMPIAERLSFNKNQVDNVQTGISLDEDSYNLRDVVDLKTTLLANDGSPISGSFSISVFDDTIQSYDNYSSSIVSQFFLESELKGHLEKPGYYFSDVEQVAAHLDLLLLTQGWKAYDMNRLAGREEVTLETLPEAGFTVTGTVKTVIGRKPLENASVMLTVGGNFDDPKIALTDKEGRFGFANLTGTGDELVTVKAEHPDKGSRVYVALNEQFEEFKTDKEKVFQGKFNQVTDIQESQQVSASTSVSEIQNRSEQTQSSFQQYTNIQMTGELDEISVTAERVSENYLDQVFGDLQGTGSSFDLDKQEYLQNIPIEFVVAQLPGVTVNKATNSIAVETGFMSFQSGGLPALVFLDGQQIDNQYLFSLNSADIKTITVARSAVDLALLGADGAGGAIVLTSQKNRILSDKKKGLITDYIRTFQEPVSFYAPRYGVNIPEDIEQEDQRITLHWNPLSTINNGVGEARFWTNDVASTYRVVIQGLSDDGIPFYSTSTFNVNR